MTLDTNTTTPRMSQVIDLMIDSRIRELYFALPAKVIEYDPETNQVSVLPQIKVKLVGNPNAMDLPIINNVPVVFPRAGAAHLRFPIQLQDFGQLLFNQRSIDIWQAAGTEVDPQDSRKFDLNDAVFIPGLFPLTKPMARGGAVESLEIKNKTGFVEITDDGKFRIKNDEAELFTNLVEIMEQLVDGFNQLGTSHQTNTIFGPQKPVNFAAYTGIKNALDALKSKLEALKGGP